MLARGPECTWAGPGWRWWWWRQNFGLDVGDSAGTYCIHHSVLWKVGRAMSEQAFGDHQEGDCVIYLGDLFNSG